MKGGAHPSPFAALSFPNSKKVPIFCWVDREFSSRRMAQPSLELTRYGDFLHHSRAALTTQPRRLSNLGIISHISPYKHTLRPSLEPSHRDGSNEGSQHMFLLRNKKIIFELSSIPHLIWSCSVPIFKVTRHPRHIVATPSGALSICL